MTRRSPGSAGHLSFLCEFALDSLVLSQLLVIRIWGLGALILVFMHQTTSQDSSPTATVAAEPLGVRSLVGKKFVPGRNWGLTYLTNVWSLLRTMINASCLNSK
jgi:hypothetical protein